MRTWTQCRRAHTRASRERTDNPPIACNAPLTPEGDHENAKAHGAPNCVASLTPPLKRGSIATQDLDSLVDYVAINKEDRTACFIDAESLTAEVILDYGFRDNPGHCKHGITLSPKKSPEYLEVLRAESRVRVQGINMVKRHRRATQTDAGGIVSMEASLHISNVAHIDPESGRATRVGYEKKDGNKIRIARRSGKALA